MIIKPAKRTESVQEYYFSKKLKEIDRMNAARMADGLPRIINLGIGSPDGMPPAEAIDSLIECASMPGNHAYQSYIGTPELRKAFASWYSRYYGVTLSPDGEIQPLFGSKEGILLISLAFINEGDKVLVPDPGYPTYTSASRLVGAEIVTYDLKEENGWQPDFDALEKMDLDGVKIMWTNYPNMPTGGRATKELYQKIVDFGLKHNILIVNDNPYSFILNDSPLSILAAKGAKECCLELNSLSKAHNMSGWRIGMVAGAREIIAEVLKVKSQMDSGMFRPMQMAAVKALEQGPGWFKTLNAEYKVRREAAGRIFDLVGARYDKNSSGLFLWGKVSPDNRLLNGTLPEGDGRSLGEMISDIILYEAGVFITPGFIFGKNGRDYIRISLCAKPEVLADAATKIAGII
ncbi:MAG: pyridoxal phosphate-dependent aminotransferase [Candidatus Cryptobacteroides sp.]|nr:aminotransferase class I/II-fold pyridoxal phosphate-dependent enzyme [Bacteroidales bacterium]